MNSDENSGAAEELKKTAAEKARTYELAHHGCGQCTLRALQETLGLEDEKVFRAASFLHGGFPVESRTCGSLLAGAMVISMKLGRDNIEEGQPGTMRGMRQIIRLVDRFKAAFGTTFCGEVTGGLTAAVIDEEVITLMEEQPEMFDEASQRVVEICANTVAKVAELVVEILGEEELEIGS
ncbi:MAG: C-GCAxxG-C-C family protein [Dehalococcoidia bacterium]